MKTKPQIAFKVGVKSLIFNKEKKFLLIKRACYPEGVWEVPGGRLDSHETLMDGLRRELQEETGIKDVKVVGLVSAQDIFPPKDKEIGHVMRLTYLSRVTSDRVILSPEHSDYRWIDLEEMTDISDLDPYLLGILKDKPILSFIKSVLNSL